MAKKATKKKATKKTASRRRNQPKSDFHRQTVLFQWALGKFGIEKAGPNDDLLKLFRDRFQMSPDSPEGLDDRTGLHKFFETVANVLPTVTDGDVVPVDRLQAYEQNIVEHTQAINTARLHHGQAKIDWKYHQYLALLLTEMFLDRYFDDPVALRDELNERIARHNGQVFDGDKVKPLSEDEEAWEQLGRLAFWCATGSGKTLLMHVHVRQFRHYHKRAYEAGKWPALDQIILVTPNDGLSRQHQTEFRHSGLNAVAAGEQGVEGLFAQHARGDIKIMDIHKFREEQGTKTVATEAFEGCNLVLVDEGHRGAGAGGEGAWLSRRNQLAQGGFTFEYSATFKEAVGSDDGVRNRYARSILFDYAYRSFYRDGYGKDFTILNLDDDERQHRYLTTALLLFYQQMRVWKDGGDAIKPFQIDKPLWVFVGHTVVGKAKNKDDKESVSDVAQVLLFLNEFLAGGTQSVELIQHLLEEGFIDHNGRDLLAGRLPHLDNSGNKETLAKQLYDGILSDIFQAPGDGSLVVQLVKEAEGELALKVGESDPFGVVNVGDPSAVADACEKNGIHRAEDDAYRSSLFHGINSDESTINMLVGSRKFTEGWNSWRVSSLGLMRMGKNEGTQIIQLFGRGVRLRGYKMSLRRSSVLAEKPNPPANLRQVETLHVFGVKSTYMNTFKDWIFSEVPEAQEKQVWDLPVVKTLPERTLKTLKLQDVIEGQRVEGGQAFRTLGPLVKLRPPHETAHEDAWLRQHKTRVNWLPRIHGIVGEGRQISGAIGEAGDSPHQSLSPMHVAMLNIDDLLFGLEAFKATRGLDRLHVDRAAIREMLRRADWYELKATSEDMRLDRYENRSQWQRMAQQLLNNYAERFYRFMRGRWEAPYIEVTEVTEDDPSMLVNYTIESTELAQTADDIDRIAQFVNDLKETLGSNALSDWRQWNGRWRTVPFAGHLYHPLLYVGKNAQIKISPVPLDKHEAQFVEDLATWCQRNIGVEVYLLRNQAITGLGFFQAANFFPDFLLWVQSETCQHLAFVDPKGLHHFDLTDPKVQFATRELPRLEQIVNDQAPELRLQAFIVSNTPFSRLHWSLDGDELMSKKDIEKLGVLFQVDEATTYIDKMMARLVPPSHLAVASEAGAMADPALAYPSTNGDNAICAAALSVVEQTGSLSSMDHLDVLLLATHPEWCKPFLTSTDQRKLDTAVAKAPAALFVGEQHSIRWTDVRDYLEQQNGLHVDHAASGQPIGPGVDIASVRASLPGGVDDVVFLGLKALERIRDLRMKIDSASRQQQPILRALLRHHKEYGIAA